MLYPKVLLKNVYENLIIFFLNHYSNNTKRKTYDSTLLNIYNSSSIQQWVKSVINDRNFETNSQFKELKNLKFRNITS